MGTALDGNMETVFQKYYGDPQHFFKLLPASWTEGLLEVWDDYALKSELFVLLMDGQIIAGGLVVKGIPEDMQHFLKEAMFWASKGYYYIGYLWVVEEYRNQDLGSKWLRQLKRHYPQKKFWLSIEEEKLADFYLRNDFRLVKELHSAEGHEWILVFEGTDK